MLDEDDLDLGMSWVDEDELPLAELSDPLSDPLEMVPDVERALRRSRPDDELGLRSLLERPEALSKPWLREIDRSRRALAA